MNEQPQVGETGKNGYKPVSVQGLAWPCIVA